MRWRLKERLRSEPPSVLAAAGLLLVSVVLYGVFVNRLIARDEGVLIRVAAWHLPLTLLALLLALYAAVRHRSNPALALIVFALLALFQYVFISFS